MLRVAGSIARHQSRHLRRRDRRPCRVASGMRGAADVCRWTPQLRSRTSDVARVRSARGGAGVVSGEPASHIRSCEIGQSCESGDCRRVRRPVGDERTAGTGSSSHRPRRIGAPHGCSARPLRSAPDPARAAARRSTRCPDVRHHATRQRRKRSAARVSASSFAERASARIRSTCGRSLRSPQ